MFEIYCVTNRSLCKNNFLERIGRIAACGVSGIILREKNLTENEYECLALKTAEICAKSDTPLILHSFYKTALKLGIDKIHLPLGVLHSLDEHTKRRFSVIGSSVHSVSEALEAEKLGCTYLAAGHIFATDCKIDIPPRGIGFLKSVCNSVNIPVYAIGGINAENISETALAGADGVLIMSGFMTCGDIAEFFAEVRK